MIKKSLFLLLFSAGAISNVQAIEPSLTPDAAIQRLREGNERFVNDKLTHPDRTSDRREATAARQNPFAVIMGCADSRIPPEIVFDQGIGDLFVVRVAGNVVGPLELDSIRFSVENNGSSVILVLGHQNCGAITAFIQKQTRDIPAVAALIESNLKGKDNLSLEVATKANVQAVVNFLRKQPALDAYLAKDKLKVVGGYYDFDTGKVELLKE